ncbi:hypothetical protein HDZ31DRAFT_66863 [Schizophyllum fasciatum]
MLNTSDLRAAPAPSVASDHLGGPERPDTPELVAKVLNTIWHDFSRWKADMARDLLRSMRPPPQPPWDGPLLTAASAPAPTSRITSYGAPLTTDDLTILEYADNGAFVQDPWTLCRGTTINAPAVFTSITSYESFGPADRNIYVGNDNNDVPYVRAKDSNDISYVRYIDSPNFDAKRELDHWHGTLSWMNIKDHDLALLVIETSRRLFVQHRISYQQQQDTEILPFSLLTCTYQTGVNHPGLLDVYIKRDLTPFSRHGLIRECTSRNFSKIIETLVTSFCPFMNCITPHCTAHNKRACPCFANNQECDPELCVGCASRDHNLGRCRNSQIQHKRRKKTVLRKSQFGIGVFAAEKIHAGELICEYVGELIYDETTRSRELLAIHRRCNYLFGLNPLLGIDAAHAGNESRFINHREHDNVAAYIKLVNGEPRIGLYANRTIKPGAELFIDYGKDFFKENDIKGEHSATESWVDPGYDDTQDWLPSTQ